jgi:hypothetical protein
MQSANVDPPCRQPSSWCDINYICFLLCLYRIRIQDSSVCAQSQST